MKRDRLAAARTLAGARISSAAKLANRTVYAEPSGHGDVLVTLIVIVPGADIDAALDAADKEKPHGP